jgi:hypothetical protein
MKKLGYLFILLALAACGQKLADYHPNYGSGQKYEADLLSCKQEADRWLNTPTDECSRVSSFGLVGLAVYNQTTPKNECSKTTLEYTDGCMSKRGYKIAN